MITGNRGEWSELYVFLKLLADGKLYAADETLKRMPDIFYPVLKVLREELGEKRRYEINNGDVVIVNGSTREEVRVSRRRFRSNAKILFERMKSVSGSTFDCPSAERFMRIVECHGFKASSGKKTDIKIVVHDLYTGKTPVLGFSIKSMLGKASTLFNAGKSTNVVYEIKGQGLTREQIDGINSDTTEPKIYTRINRLQQAGGYLCFSGIESDTLQLNMQLIDSDLPQIIACLLLYKYTDSADSSLTSLLEAIKVKNPLGFDLSQGHPFYEYKIKNFLTDVALGMTPSKVWSGKYDATGGIIIVKKDGDIVCYHIYNRNEFQDYLLRNTKFEQASTFRYQFGDLYTDNGRVFLKLNLQIRFVI